MSRKKIQIAFVVIFLLLVSIIFLTLFVKQNTLLEEKEKGNSFFIVNGGNTSHEVFVEAFNSKNNSIFNESYISPPGKTISSQFTVKLTPGAYIEVTLDNNITKTQNVSNDASDVMLSINIDMNPDDPFYIGLSVP